MLKHRRLGPIKACRPSGACRKSQIPTFGDVYLSRRHRSAASRPTDLVSTAVTPRLLQIMLSNSEPMIEDNARPEKPLARTREESDTISAKGPAAPDHMDDTEAPDTAAQPTTPGSPARSRPRPDTAVDELDPANVATQPALQEGRRHQPSQAEAEAARALEPKLGSRENTMTDDPTALGGELRVRPMHPQRTNNSATQIAYRALATTHTCTVNTPPPARCMNDRKGAGAASHGQSTFSPAPESSDPAPPGRRPPSMSTPPTWWDQARTTIPPPPRHQIWPHATLVGNTLNQHRSVCSRAANARPRPSPFARFQSLQVEL
jgi:hypothetical protein